MELEVALKNGVGSRDGVIATREDVFTAATSVIGKATGGFAVVMLIAGVGLLVRTKSYVPFFYKCFVFRVHFFIFIFIFFETLWYLSFSCL